jgi:hypothetical protein
MRVLRAGVAALALAVPLALASGMAAALSCADYSIRDAYWTHEASPETYLLVQGSFTNLTLVEAVATAETDQGIAPGKTTYAARFTGFKPSARAFDQPFEAEVTLVFPDFSMIGGGYDSALAVDGLPGLNGLVWLRDTGAGYALTAELCAPLIDTDPGSVKPALRCLAGGYCPKPK